jgi:hypothetical protein
MATVAAAAAIAILATTTGDLRAATTATATARDIITRYRLLPSTLAFAS